MAQAARKKTLQVHLSVQKDSRYYLQCAILIFSRFRGEFRRYPDRSGTQNEAGAFNSVPMQQVPVFRDGKYNEAAMNISFISHICDITIIAPRRNSDQKPLNGKTPSPQPSLYSSTIFFAPDDSLKESPKKKTHHRRAALFPSTGFKGCDVILSGSVTYILVQVVNRQLPLTNGRRAR